MMMTMTMMMMMKMTVVYSIGTFNSEKWRIMSKEISKSSSSVFSKRSITGEQNC